MSRLVGKATSAFNKFASKVETFTNQTINDAHNLVKESTNAKEKAAFTSLWEESEAVVSCRACRQVFESPLAKHHCRSCGGVFCDDCCTSAVTDDFQRQFLLPPSLIPADGESTRICITCKRAEGPSREFKERIRTMLDNDPDIARRRSLDIVDKLGNKLVAKISEAVGDKSDLEPQGCRPYQIGRGSLYGENNMPRKAAKSKPVAVSGYCEIYNKSSTPFAVKILAYGQKNNIIFELPRPSYYAVPPTEAIYTMLEPGENRIEIVVLHDNPNHLQSGMAIVHDTSAPGLTPQQISPACRIDGFRQARVYMIESKGKNVLLKHKGDGLLHIRLGSNVGRVGLLGYLQSLRHRENMLDYNTNISSMVNLMEI